MKRLIVHIVMGSLYVAGLIAAIALAILISPIFLIIFLFDPILVLIHVYLIVHIEKAESLEKISRSLRGNIKNREINEQEKEENIVDATGDTNAIVEKQKQHPARSYTDSFD